MVKGVAAMVINMDGTSQMTAWFITPHQRRLWKLNEFLGGALEYRGKPFKREVVLYGPRGNMTFVAEVK